jgi:glycerol-3-phosphate acyltransferase PlsX
VHIALDAMGGDRGPEELLVGVGQAISEANIEVTLFGDEKTLSSILKKNGLAKEDRLHIVHTSEVVDMAESPIDAVRRKRDSSISVAFDYHKSGKVDAVVSAGNSGATMAAAVRSLGRLKHVARPGIASIFPTLKEPVIMMDVGANVDCRPKHLFQFGIMASAFAEVILGSERPRVGVLSIGEERGKGNTLVRKTDALFRQSTLNYIGNIEGGDTFCGDVDVIVCDGFVGNVCLKISEGLAVALTSMLREEILKSPMARAGYMLSRGAFSRFKRKIDYAEYGGAPLLGLKGTGIVCHGRSNALAIKNAIFVAAEMVKNKVNERIISNLAESDAYLMNGENNVDTPPEGDMS